MKHRLLLSALTILTILLLTVIPVWIGPDFGPDINTGLGLIVEWFCGLLAIAMAYCCILFAIGACQYVWGIIYSFFDDLLRK